MRSERFAVNAPPLRSLFRIVYPTVTRVLAPRRRGGGYVIVLSVIPSVILYTG